MRISLFAALMLISGAIIAKDWAPIGAKWTYEHEEGSSPYMTVMESVKDTIVQGKTCRKLVTKRTDLNCKQDGTTYWSTGIISIDYIYESNDTVYHYDECNETFYPLYIMNVKPLDTILVRKKNDYCPFGLLSSRFEYVVDSISEITIQNQKLKVIYNSALRESEWVFNHSYLELKYPIIERFGSLLYFFGVQVYNSMEGSISGLRCYQDNEISYKADYWTHDCDYLPPLTNWRSAIKNISNEINAFPNPFNEYIKIETNCPAEYELYDSYGRLLMQGEGNTINTSYVNCGIYILKVASGKDYKVIQLLK